MFAQDLINKIIGNQIYFQGDGYYAATMYQGRPAILTNAVEEFENGIIWLDELDFETLEHIAKFNSWWMEEPTIHM